MSSSGVSPENLEKICVPPENAENRRDAETTLVKRQGFFLPHWTMDGAIYHVVFRLRDSLPHAVLIGFQEERDQLKRQASRGEISHELANRLDFLVSERVDAYLDAGHGECPLKKPQAAEIVASALKHFDGDRYRLHAWAVMPNHVHVIVEPLAGHQLDKITHTWKSFTAHEINKRLRRTGEVWMKESYDHLIRNEGSYHALVQYVLDKPTNGKLKDWMWVGRGTGVPPV